jgi:ribosomal protein L16 Arg81 hydroxylase
MGGGSAGPSKRPARPLQQPPAAPPPLKPEQHNNAGAQPAQPGASECDLRRVDARTLTQDEFRADYQGREPLLLTHAASSWAAVASWATPSLITAAHGDVELQLQDPQLLTKKGTFAPMVSVLPLADYLENLSAERQPFFRNRWHSLTDRVLADVNFSSVPTRSVRSHHILSLGGVGTGVGFHSHSESWLAQIQGRKFWSLARSLGPGWQTKHGCEWATQASASKNGASKKGASKNGGGGDDEPWYLEMMGLRERPLHQCVVDPGDAIYIPTGWYHSTCSTLAILSYTPSLLLPLPPLAPFSCAPSS